MSAHAFLPPSGAAAWVHCAAWPLMNATFPQDDTDESREGTAAHWCWEAVLSAPALGAQVVLPVVGQLAPNGVQVTDEMLDGAEEYIAVVTDAARAAGVPLTELHVEERVYMPGIHAQNDGTPDTWFFDAHRLTIHLFDYKFGHDPVEAFENWQLIDYANGIIDYLCSGPLAHWHHRAIEDLRLRVRVRMVVVQPRNYISGRCEPWEIDGHDLRAYWERLRVQAVHAMAYPPQATPGNHCKHCPGRHACKPLQQQGYQAVHFARQTAPAVLDADAVASELRILQDNAAMLKARISGLEADAEARLRAGQSVPGYGLEPTRGRERWTAPRENVIALAAVLGVKVEKQELITPNQARAAGMQPAVVAQLSGSSSGVKLARVEQRDLQKVFGPAGK